MSSTPLSSGQIGSILLGAGYTLGFVGAGTMDLWGPWLCPEGEIESSAPPYSFCPEGGLNLYDFMNKGYGFHFLTTLLTGDALARAAYNAFTTKAESSPKPNTQESKKQNPQNSARVRPESWDASHPYFQTSIWLFLRECLRTKGELSDNRYLYPWNHCLQSQISEELFECGEAWTKHKAVTNELKELKRRRKRNGTLEEELETEQKALQARASHFPRMALEFARKHRLVYYQAPNEAGPSLQWNEQWAEGHFPYKK